jgi:hypothetical protein
LEIVRFRRPKLPPAVTWNNRKGVTTERKIVSPVPVIVIGLVIRNADGPAGCGTAVVLTGGLENVVRLTVPPTVAPAKTMVSASGTAFACVIASRKLPAPESFRFVTVNVAGVVRSSRISTDR